MHHRAMSPAPTIRTGAGLVGSVVAALVAFVAQGSEDGGADSAPTREGGVLREFAWLSGTWGYTSEEGVTTEEHWRPLQGTTMLGTSHTFDAKSTRFFEFLRVAQRGDGVAYVAQPGGGAATPFALARHGTGADGAVVGSFVEFENAEHDAPQRIRYERTATGLRATISQLDGTGVASWDFTAR
jgi:hypothetical protein